MDDTGRLALVIGALLGVPVIVILLVTGSDDGQVYRRDPPAAATAEATSPPAASPTPTPGPVAVEVETAELPRLDGCEDGALLDEDARGTAFRDGLGAEGDGSEISEDTAAWLGALEEELSACRQALQADRNRLRSAIEAVLAATAAYRAALEAPEDNSVSGAWSDLDDALEHVIDVWAGSAS